MIDIIFNAPEGEGCGFAEAVDEAVAFVESAGGVIMRFDRNPTAGE